MIHGHICDWNFVCGGFDEDLAVPLIWLPEPEDGGTMILQKADNYLPTDMAQHPWRTSNVITVITFTLSPSCYHPVPFVCVHAAVLILPFPSMFSILWPATHFNPACKNMWIICSKLYQGFPDFMSCQSCHLFHSCSWLNTGNTTFICDGVSPYQILV